MKKFIHTIYKLIFNIPFIKGIVTKKNNEISIRCRSRRNKINITGRENTINIAGDCQIKKSSFHIYGNNNKIIIKNGAFCNGVEFYIEDDDGEIIIGNNTVLNAKSHLAVIEGTKINIGNNCLFSSNVVFRTGDSHSILDKNGKRINKSQDIIVADNVWIGYDVKINKGAKISENSIIGTGSVITKEFEERNVIIAGVPAKIIKHNVNWCAQRIAVT